jgi:hypothetical protein
MSDAIPDKAVIAFTEAWEAERQRIGRGVAPAGTKTRAGLAAALPYLPVLRADTVASYSHLSDGSVDPDSIVWESELPDDEHELVRINRELAAERDQLAAMVLAARSYFGVNETSYVVKMLDSASEVAGTFVAARDANTKAATRQATLKEVLMAYRTMRHEFLPWLRDHIEVGGDTE